MIDKDLTLALAESMTCGMAADKLATCPGTAEVLRGSVVCYHEQVKKELLKVTASRIKKYTAESAQVTEDLAKGLKQLITADIYGAITGLASSGGSETKTKPVGTVFFCILFKGKLIKQKKLYRGTPLQIREKACFGIYDLITREVIKKI